MSAVAHSAAQPAEERGVGCYHCGLPVADETRFEVEIDGATRAMCCPGCQAVARAILAQGLVDYYRHRDAPGTRPDTVPAELLEQLRVYDDEQLQRDFVRVEPEHVHVRRATLAIEGITCAACTWLIERRLLEIPGVVDASVHLSSHRATVAWDDRRAMLSTILSGVAEVGYRAHPYVADRHEELLQREERESLKRLGVAGLGMMQVMMFAVGLYAGAFQGMEAHTRDLLRVVSLLVATPVVLYSARPFFRGALRDLRARRPGMDVPVALAIGGAYMASLWATAAQRGDVYFDSVCMFTFFLGAGRHLELRMRLRSDAQARSLLSAAPKTARRVASEDADDEEIVPVRNLRAGDLVAVRAGESIPADGLVVSGEASVDESLLSGEPLARLRTAGDAVIGGSQSVEGWLLVRISRVGAQATLATIVALLDRARADRPRVARQADRVAHWFVGFVLLAAAGVGAAWAWIDPSVAVPATLAMLVASCPCALSLATPAAVAAATGGLARAGLLVTRGHVLEGLASLTRLVFDKTGTLTQGAPIVERVVPVRAVDPAWCVGLARALEQHSEHPIAAAFAGWPSPEAEDAQRHFAHLRRETDGIKVVAGRGVEGRVQGRLYRLGRPDWASGAERTEQAVAPGFADAADSDASSFILLCDANGAVAWFGLADPVRDDAASCVEGIRARRIAVELLSGDPSPAVAQVARRVGASPAIAGARPEEKLEHVRNLQRAGEIVAMVGDGINDAPVLAQADVSIAMGGGSDLARVSADAVLLGDRLSALPEAIDHARRARRVIRQNLGWALLYNVCVLPFAALGLLAPYQAALGMSLSSLLVTANALRLATVRAPA